MSDATKHRRWIGLLAAAVALPMVFLLLLAMGIYDALHPDAPAEDLQARVRPVLGIRTSAAPLAIRTGCSIIAHSVGPNATPLFDVQVEAGPSSPRDDPWVVDGMVDGNAVVILDDLPCGGVRLAAVHPELVGPSPQAVWLVPGEPQPLELQFLPGIEVTGTVRSAAGDPVEGAQVTIQDGGDVVVETDSNGRYSRVVRLLSQGSFLLALEADALGFQSEHRRVLLMSEGMVAGAGKDTGAPAGSIPREDGLEMMTVSSGDTIEVDFSLPSKREVRVWCAGLPSDLCNDMSIMCTHPLSPVGDGCKRDRVSGETVCDCSEQSGAVAIRGGGKSTLVQVDEPEAWLDFRDGGSLVGRVVANGADVSQCDVVVLRIPSGLEDLSRGLVAAHKSECDVEGRFEVTGLVDGDWEVIVEVFLDDTGTLRRLLEPTRVRPRQATDVGEIEMLAGGGIEGRAVDGLTGETVDDAPILAVKRGDRNARSTPFFAEIDRNGNFTFDGLPPGEWELCYFLTPHVRTYVTVEDGAITDGVTVETSEATALETNGFSLAVDDGDLMVRAVESDSPASDAGLLEGDRIEGVLVAGLDIGSYLGDRADRVMQMVLGHWDGPGVTLVVERDGDTFELPLDW